MDPDLVHLLRRRPGGGTPWMFFTKPSGNTVGTTCGYLGDKGNRYVKERLGGS